MDFLTSQPWFFSSPGPCVLSHKHILETYSKSIMGKGRVILVNPLWWPWLHWWCWLRLFSTVVVLFCFFARKIASHVTPTARMPFSASSPKFNFPGTTEREVRHCLCLEVSNWTAEMMINLLSLPYFYLLYEKLSDFFFPLRNKGYHIPIDLNVILNQFYFILLSNLMKKKEI